MFFEYQFPPRISANAQGGPRFFTSKAYMPSGQRTSNRMALLPVHEYTIDHPIRSGADFEELRAFFYVVGGDADGFRFKDWTDFQATGTNSSATLLTTTTIQLNRIYSFGNRTFTRPIKKPNSGTVKIFRTRSGVTTDITGTSTINFTTGIVTIVSHASGDTYNWTGEFDVPVAFKDPMAMWQVIGTSKIYTEWPAIELEEFRIP